MFDGSPHGATVHFAHTEEPLIFYFETYPEYRKAEPLLKNASTRTSFVIGSDESNMKTFQLDGTARLIKDDEKQKFENVYLTKFPEKRGKYEQGKFVTFLFEPTWWRFTDWTAPGGKLILKSN